jgi:hypothetical protein
MRFLMLCSVLSLISSSRLLAQEPPWLGQTLLNDSVGSQVIDTLDSTCPFIFFDSLSFWGHPGRGYYKTNRGRIDRILWEAIHLDNTELLWSRILDAEYERYHYKLFELDPDTNSFTKLIQVYFWSRTLDTSICITRTESYKYISYQARTYAEPQTLYFAMLMQRYQERRYAPSRIRKMR